MNIDYLRPWKEEFDRTERFLTTLVVLAVAAYTAFSAWDMRTTLHEEGCEVFVKQHGGVADNASLEFYNKEDLERPEYEENVSDLSGEKDFSYSSTNIR